MNKGEVTDLLSFICDASAKAIDKYAEISGETPDQMPEYFMATSVFLALTGRRLQAVLEANATIIRKHIGVTKDEEGKLDNILKEMKGGKIDLFTIFSDESINARRAVGFIEFKKWYFDENNDFPRLTTLLSVIPGAGFGACVIMRDTEAEHSWHAEIGKRIPSLIVVAKDVTVMTRENNRCCVVGFAQLPSAT